MTKPYAYKGHDVNGKTVYASDRTSVFYKGARVTEQECRFWRALQNASTAVTEGELVTMAGVGARTARRYITRYRDFGVIIEVPAVPARRWKITPESFSNTAKEYVNKIEEAASSFNI